MGVLDPIVVVDGKRWAATALSLEQEQAFGTCLMVTTSFLHPQP